MAEGAQLKMPPAASTTSTARVADLLAASRETGILDRSSALRLAEEAPLDDLLAAASQLRAQGKGTTVSFSKKVFIPLTTLCRDYCGYCTFRKDPGQPGAHFMTPEEVLALAKRRWM
jgi:2-iminoacetate synthase ThiH